MMTEKKTITADESGLRRLTESIAEQSEGFQIDLKALEECLSELFGFWSGTAASSYAAGLSDDIEQFEKVSAVFSELAANCHFALVEYEKNARRTMEIVRALRIL